MGIISNVREFFSSKTSVTSADSVSSNELDESIKDLSGRYRLGSTEVGQYIKFGTYDDFPEILEKMLRQSPVHSGILTKKAKMVAGNDISYEDDFLPTKKAKVELKVFLNNCGGNNKGLHDVIDHAAFQYENKGAMALYVKWNKDRSKIAELKSLDPKGVRAAEPNEKGEVTH